jgi:hypothetical protein
MRARCYEGRVCGLSLLRRLERVSFGRKGREDEKGRTHVEDTVETWI